MEISFHRLVSSLINYVTTEGILLISYEHTEPEILDANEYIRNTFREVGESNVISNISNMKGVLLGKSVSLPIQRKLSQRELALGWTEYKYSVRGTVIPGLPTSCLLVTFTPTPDYCELRRRLEIVEFMVDISVRRSALFLLNKATGDAKFEYVSRRHAEILGVDRENLLAEGLRGFKECTQTPYRTGMTKVLMDTAARLGKYEARVRYIHEGQVKWVRCCGNSSPYDDEFVQISASTEDFTENEKMITKVAESASAIHVLSSFLTAMFDVNFSVDSKFRFTEETEKLRYFFSVPNGKTIKGRPLEIYLSRDEDKQRFRDFVNNQLYLFEESSTGVPAAPMIRLQMSLDCGTLTEVEICAAPHDTEICSLWGPDGDVSHLAIDQFVDDTIGLPKYLVGMNVISTKSSAEEGSSGQCESPEIITGKIPRHSPGTFSVKSYPPSLGKRTRKRLSKHPSVSRLTELSEDIFQSVETYDEPVPTTRAPRHLLLIQSLSRDLHASLDYEKLKATSIPPKGWRFAAYVVHDMHALRDEIIRTLPRALQSEFTAFLDKGLVRNASRVLAHSLEGNLDIFSHETLGATIKSSQLISATFRLFLAYAVSATEPATAIQTIHGLSQWAFRIHNKYTVTKGVLINTHLALALATVALKFPHRFESVSAQAWLRSRFAACLSCNQAFKDEKSETSPLLHWTCTLWSFLFHVFGNDSQSINLLMTVLDDMQNYIERFPEAIAVKRLIDISQHNLSIIRSKSLSY